MMAMKKMMAILLLMVWISGCNNGAPKTADGSPSPAEGFAARSTPAASERQSPASSAYSAAVKANVPAAGLSSAGAPAASAGKSLNRISRQESGLDEIAYLDSDFFTLDERILPLLRDPGPYSDGDYQAGIVLNGEGHLLLTGKFKGVVAGGVRIGTAMSQAVKLLGEPSIRKEDMLFYKTGAFYLGIKGAETVEEAIVGKTPPLNYPNDILEQIRHMLNDSSESDLLTQLDRHPDIKAFFDNVSHINGGGWYARAGTGISVTDFDQSYITVSNNFAGELVRNQSGDERYSVQYENTDSVADALSGSLGQYDDVNELFRKEGKPSPSGRLLSIYEWVYSMRQYFTIRTADGSTPDYEIHVPATDDAWLTDDCLLYMDAFEEVPKLILLGKKEHQVLELPGELGLSEKEGPFSLADVKDHVITLKKSEGRSAQETVIKLRYTENGDKSLHFERVE